MAFKVALVGRTNVGKSSLFNRIFKKRTAIVSPRPGVTLDRIEGILDLNGKKVVFTDTGGVPAEEDRFTPHMLRQWEKAVNQADLVLFLVDAKEGLTPLDEEVASTLRKKGKQVILVVNKVDNPQREEEALLEFSPLGIEMAVATSVAHGREIRELLEIVEDLAPEEDEEEQAIPMATLAILGRPNVGKSSLVNLLAGEERVVVTEIPGTTRDAVDVLVEWDGNRLLLVDTAGLRRKSRVSSSLEAYSITRSVEAIKRASVCLLMLDASEGPTEQDQKIASVVIRNYRPLVVALFVRI
jgi:GTP-binding protein